MVQSFGDAEVSANPGQAGAVSHGGAGVGLSYDDTGYNIAAAAPGEGFAYSKRWPESSSTFPAVMDSPGREGLDPGSVAIGAVGGAGAAAGGAAACCCCVIL